MIRQATIEDASRIAEISIFTKRMNYRFIFRNDKVSFGEMQVYPLADSYIHDPQLLKGIWVLEKNTDAQRFYSKHGFVKTGERKLEEGTDEYIIEMKR